MTTKKMSSEKFKFKGWDYTELSEKWGLKNAKASGIKDYITDVFHIRDEKQIKGVVKDVRDYLKALIKCSKKNDFKWPLWEGLLNITDDETLLQYTCNLVEGMWT
jgi:hypothetical protein